MGDDRPIRYTEPGKIVYRASSLGMCERAMLAAAKGLERKPHPAWFQEVLEEGAEAEEQILAMYTDELGFPVVDQQREVELWVMDTDDAEVVIRGHIDGMREWEGDPVLVEAKKFRDSTWPRFIKSGVEINANYPWQVSVYMHALGVTSCDFVGGHWQDGHITAAEVKVLSNPPIPMKAIRTKIARVERLLHEGWDPTDPVGQEGGPTCAETTYPCAYWYLHGQGRAAPDTPRISLPAHLIDTVADYHHGKMLEAQGKKQAEEARKVILEAMGEATAGKVGDWHVDITEYTQPEKVVKGYTARRLNVTIPEEETK